MATFTAIYDACVLYPAPLRDLLVGLATTGLFRARWTDEIHEEWINNLLINKPHLTREALNRTKELMDAAVADCLVTGYEKLIPSLTLPDADDRHVLAAAIRSCAEVIVTFNLKDFPSDALNNFGVFAEHPDDFISNLLDLNQKAVIRTVKNQRARLKNPPITSQNFIDTLRRQQLTKTAAFLDDAIDFI
ncbi:conserved hypothetical protein [Magnetococcus marinus MC-1]|uniref:Uncharacterized protein n=1 Tax=Magnetococcus marinus (strain ATCC BAA-1437 / JCM 17883 / MC-1) TaxID=156889 RepID=A0L5H2_MAGMM|nr:PIN domain-containing protein [Magnetococcus marinus]ABK43215.1 conserved hypothetical protein [Magnetococcus marinus MC-1]